MTLNSHLYRLKAIILVLICITTTAFADSTKANEIDFIKLKNYAELANAAYQSESFIEETSDAQHYILTLHSNIPQLEVTYFLLTDESTKKQIIVVRGTANTENAVIDASFKLLLDKQSGIYLHDGFSAAAKAVYAEVKPKLITGYSISTTGHSLGGAVAIILGMYLQADDFKVGEIITFGQPKVSNVAGAKKYKRLNHIRVVTPRDVVPLVPPFDIVDFSNPDIYWHSGKEVVLLKENTYALLEGADSMLRATKFTQEPFNENNINNHKMSLYIQMINKKLEDAKLVPYENSYNLFNLFGG